MIEFAKQKNIEVKYVHLNLTTPTTCFRALNNLACLLDASKQYKKGISLDELMLKIEEKLSAYQGYLILMIDEIDHINTQLNTFLKFIIKRLPQSVQTKIISVFISNKLDWAGLIDPRIKSFMKMNELIYPAYTAIDLKKNIRNSSGKKY